MNVKSFALLSFSFGVISLIAPAQPTVAEVSVEIISRSNSVTSSVTSLNTETDSRASFQSSSTVSEQDQEGHSQRRSDSSLEDRQDSFEPSDDDFEGILFRI